VLLDESNFPPVEQIARAFSAEVLSDEEAKEVVERVELDGRPTTCATGTGRFE
jgi:hypothetical protein